MLTPNQGVPSVSQERAPVWTLSAMATVVVPAGRSAGSVRNSIETSKWKDSHHLHIKNRSKLTKESVKMDRKSLGRQLQTKSTLVHVLD
ncbi:hypothetical protein Y032_0039g105 [Ancylostoma ceylanicum]|uniref:Uncharacterized protein n=1 Tax=Ancylostoma ceylanicum TaxID=53326 RepID=A0A016UIH9_9BILA|nr:hypothetical protein Y032_0039g105 [Ancylostoma ceylanicum]